MLVQFSSVSTPVWLAELPDLIKLYDGLHAKGFEILSVDMDSNRDRVTSVINDRKIGWRQYFDGKGRDTKLAQKYGVTTIPASFLIDGEGKIIGKDLRGPKLAEAVEAAVGGK